MASAVVVLWQSSRLAMLWDVSYVLENATRIAAGDVPYRDFPFPYAPLTFVVQAAIIRLFGRVYWHHIAYAVLACGVATALAYLVVRRFVPRATAVCLTLPLALLGPYCILPHPFYDPDACLAIVALIAMLMGARPTPSRRYAGPSPRLRGEGALSASEGRVRGDFCRMAPLIRRSAAPSPRERGEGPAAPPLIRRSAAPSPRAAGRRAYLCRASLPVGALCIVPLFVKQNIGLAFVTALVILLIAERRWRVLAGVAIGAAIAVALVAAIFGVGNYAAWTLSFAAARRLPPLAMMLGVYSDPIVWWGIGIVLLSFLNGRLRWLVAVPWLFILYRFFASDDPNEREINLLRIWPLILVVATIAALALWRREEPMLRSIPLLVVATIHGTFLSQATWGSTYGIWPLLVILLAFVFRAAKAPPAVAAIVAAVTLLSAAHYLRIEGRLLYAKWNEGAMQTSSLPSLRGLRMRGEWLPEFDELVVWTDAHVPRGDGILFLPGEDLFCFATGRRPRFPVVMVDRTINPYTPAQIAAIAEQRGIRWVVVKRRLQLNGTPYPELGDTIHLLRARYQPVAFLRNYVVWSDRPLP